MSLVISPNVLRLVTSQKTNKLGIPNKKHIPDFEVNTNTIFSPPKIYWMSYSEVVKKNTNASHLLEEASVCDAQISSTLAAISSTTGVDVSGLTTTVVGLNSVFSSIGSTSTTLAGNISSGVNVVVGGILIAGTAVVSGVNIAISEIGKFISLIIK